MREDFTADPILAGISAQVDKKIREQRAASGQWSLGELLISIAGHADDLVVAFSTGKHPGRFISYRGYYDQIALEPTDDPVMLGEFRKSVTEAIGETFTGYKGGEYTMDRYTPVWVSSYGECSDDGVIGVHVERARLVIDVADIESSH